MVGLSNDVSENLYLVASSVWVLYASNMQLKGGGGYATDLHNILMLNPVHQAYGASWRPWQHA